MVECVNLRKKYMTVTAVEDISLNIQAGKMYALLGPHEDDCGAHETDIGHASV